MPNHPTTANWVATKRIKPETFFSALWATATQASFSSAVNTSLVFFVSISFLQHCMANQIV
jgi:hypothetical protein